MGNNGSFNKWCYIKKTSIWKKRLGLYFILYTTTNFKWIAVLSVKENVVKLLEDHVQEHICYGSDLS